MGLPLAMAMAMVMAVRRRRNLNYRSRLKRETRITAMAVRSKSKETRRIRKRKLNYRSMLERFILSSQSSSSSPPPPEDSKSVCIIASMFSKNTTYCFKFDPDQSSSSLSIDDSSNGVGVGVGVGVGGGELMNHRILSPNSGTCKCKIEMWGGNCYAAIGSTMYWFGPTFEMNPQSKFPEFGWKYSPPMILPHRGDNHTVIDGKLYVFGGGVTEHGDSWGEFFDPIKIRWEALPDPPVLLNQATTSVFFKKILVGVCESGEFYGYDPMTNSWSLLSTSRIHLKPGLFGKAVRVNNTLYWFNKSRLLLDAYDLDQRMWFVGYFQHLKLDGLVVGQCHKAYFFHLGGDGDGNGDDENLCMLWENIRLDSESGLMCINFVKFRVTKRIDYVQGEGVLDMHIQSSQMFLMDPRFGLRDVFMST